MSKKPEDIIHQSICDDLCQMDIDIKPRTSRQALEGDEGSDFIGLLVQTALHQLENAGFVIVPKEPTTETKKHHGEAMLLNYQAVLETALKEVS